MSLRVVVATRRCEKIRDELFAAGWTPGAVTTSGKIRHLLLKLNKASAAVTHARMRDMGLR